MTQRIFNLIGRAASWLAHRPGVMLTLASDDALAAELPRRLGPAWLGVLGWGVVWGVTLMAAWSLTAIYFGSVTGLWIMPAVAAAVMLGLGTSRRLISEAAQTLLGGDVTARAVFACSLLIVLALGLIAGRSPNSHEDVYGVLPNWFGWVRPAEYEARILFLMPLWGAWSMLITSQFCRCCDCTEAAIKAFRKGCGAVAATFSLALPWACTWFYFGYMGWNLLTLAGSATGGAVVIGILMCRYGGGLTRRTLLTTNLLVQFLVLVVYIRLVRMG